MSLPVLYRGSVKDLLGHFRVGTENALIFDYSDAYSVFDWGRMPDALARKGEALATLAGVLFEMIESPAEWKRFAASPACVEFLNGSPFGQELADWGAALVQDGLRTHYMGATQAEDLNSPRKLLPATEAEAVQPVKQITVRAVNIPRPQPGAVLRTTVYDYAKTHEVALPRLIPLEVVFRFSCPEGSSLIERAARDPGYLAAAGFPGRRAQAGEKWAFPVLECFTKLESTDRHLPLSEALGVAGLSAENLHQLLGVTAWVAAFLRWRAAEAGLELADGKLEWALAADGSLMLVDAIGPDELRLLYRGVQLSKEFLRLHYRKSAWYSSLAQGKETARAQGKTDWKAFVKAKPEPLPAEIAALGSQLYLTLANALSGRRIFPEAWALPELAARVDAATRGGA